MNEKIRNLIEILNEAAKAYYSTDVEIMDNIEYDRLYNELENLEKESGIMYPDSPTQKVGYEVVSKLAKIKHEEPTLGLDKFQDKNDGREKLISWLGENIGVLSIKMDGLTLVCTYESKNTGNAKLVSCVTRGNGIVGEDVLHNSKYISGLPQEIAYKGKIIIRGEVLISYPDFDIINSTLPEGEELYKNPRNLATGSIRTLDSAVAAQRHLQFKCFGVVSYDYGPMNELPYERKLASIEAFGISVVKHKIVNKDNLVESIEWFESFVKDYELPSDGLVLRLNDSVLSQKLGSTGKYPRYAMAFKWADDEVVTTLKDIEWNATRTGKVSITAVFEPVEIDGTTVSRASLHNLNIVEKLELGIGDQIKVAKMNMIIPAVTENLTKSNSFQIPKICPACGFPTRVEVTDTTKFLCCDNPECAAKKINLLEHFCERDCMNIEGLSGTTLNKFVEIGFIKELPDIYSLWEHAEELIKMDGFGQKSYDNLMNAIESSRRVPLECFINALGIYNVGKDTAKIIAKHCVSYENFVSMLDNKEDFSICDGVGDIINSSMHEWYSDKHREMIKMLSDELVIEDSLNAGDKFAGLIVVITGSLSKFANRDALKKIIEDDGGKVSGSVSKKTSMLINNDVTSTSGKNKDAMSLGIPIISEDEFISKYSIEI